ncbi:MAG: FAD-dependent oxidoreductase [Acidimicrobiales bacterium]
MTLRYLGTELQASEGESVAAALVAAGEYACRTTRSSASRGVFCGMGVCGECAMTIQDEPGQLACMTKVSPGMNLALNPAARRFDGLVRDPLSEEVIASDLLVIGAGPAGLSAAHAAARTGATVTVVDERAEPGGQYFKQPASSLRVDEGELDSQYRAGRKLQRQVAEAQVEVLSGTRVWGHCGVTELYASSSARRFVLRPRAVVIATGAFERAVPFPGWTLPGVMTTGAAQTLLRSYLVAAGERVLVSGNGPLNLQVAAELVGAGVKVVAVAELASLVTPLAPLHLAAMSSSAPRYLFEGFNYIRTLAARGIPILRSSTVVEVRGTNRAEEATVAQIDRAGNRVPGTDRCFEVDAVCLGLGFVPTSELARSLGCSCRVDERTGSLVLDLDRNGRSSVPGIWVAGDGSSVRGAPVAQAAGILAGLDAAASLGFRAKDSRRPKRWRARVALHNSERFQRSLWSLYRAPRLTDNLATSDTIVCRCEEVTLAALRDAMAPWLASAGSIKRATRAGMGKCQGRYCSPIVIDLAARATGEPAAAHSSFAPQMPFTPVRVGAIASDGPIGPGPPR